MSVITDLKEKVLAGGSLTDDEVYSLLDVPSADLREAAAEVTAALSPRRFDSCSIVNARSGRCSENCKWCAQSAHYHTGCDTYPLIDESHCMAMARHNASRGVMRFSLVASGRSVKGEALQKMASMLRRAKDETGIGTCASMGLLTADELQTLWDAGVRRYHCNLETAPSHFATLCTTHTVDDKLATIEAARRIGFEVCSGGIIGMGETMTQRVELALTLRQVKPLSIPINLLHPIPGTPLENAAPLSEEEILRTVAVFRFVHPGVQLRFAGGRALMSEHTQLRAMRIAVNGAIVGDLLTTIGSTVEADRKRIAEAGYEF